MKRENITSLTSLLLTVLILPMILNQRGEYGLILDWINQQLTNMYKETKMILREATQASIGGLFCEECGENST